MPTGNAGITQGLALRLTNMEQGRREVTANALARERMDAARLQREAAMRYRQAEADRKDAERKQKQLDDLAKNINIMGKDLDPVFIGEQQKETAEFLNRTLNGMKDNPNYTSTANYHADMSKMLGNLNMRLYSSKNLALADKKIANNADDWEYRPNMQKARENTDYESFVRENGGTDFVGVDAITQPKFNRQKVEKAMLEYSTANQPYVSKPERVGGVERIQQWQEVNPALLDEMRDAYMHTIANSQMDNSDFIKQSQQIDEVYQSIKGRKIYADPKYYNRTYAPQKTKNPKAASNSVETVKTGNKTTHTYTDAIVTENDAPSGVILTYTSTGKNTSMPPIVFPKGALIGGDNGKWREADTEKYENTYKMTNPQYHIITKGAQKGAMVLYGSVIDDKNISLGMKLWKMPTEQGKAILGINQLNGITKDKMQFNFENGEYTYKINSNVTVGASKSVQKKAATSNKSTPQKQKRSRWNAVTHKMEKY
jgi:hypothetical protein